MSRSSAERVELALTGRTLVSVGVLSILLGVLTGSAASAALGLALTAVPAAVYALLRATLRRVTLTRSAPTRASEGDLVTVTTTITNPSRWPIFFPIVRDVFGAETLRAREVAFARRVDPGASASETWVATCGRTRGIHIVGPMVLELSDPLGWFTLRRRFDPPIEFKLYPKLQNRALPDRLFASLTGADPQQRMMRIAESDEFRTVRDFIAGDQVRRVHWPLTARRGYPVVREFLPAHREQLALLLDVSRQLRFSGAEIANFEASIRLVASLAARAVRGAFQVELCGGSRGTFDVRAADGAGQLLRILEMLIRVRTRSDDSFTTTVERFARRATASAAAVLVVHPYLFGDAAFLAAVAGLARRGTRVVAVIHPRRPDATESDAVEEERFLAKLGALGVELWSDRGVPLGSRRGRRAA